MQAIVYDARHHSVRHITHWATTGDVACHIACCSIHTLIAYVMAREPCVIACAMAHGVFHDVRHGAKDEPWRVPVQEKAYNARHYTRGGHDARHKTLAVSSLRAPRVARHAPWYGTCFMERTPSRAPWYIVYFMMWAMARDNIACFAP